MSEPLTNQQREIYCREARKKPYYDMWTHRVLDYEATVADLERQLDEAQKRIMQFEDRFAKNAEEAGDSGWFEEQGLTGSGDEEG